jgi:glutathione peroxidase
LKIKVNGIEEIPLYKYLKAQQGGGILGDDIKWNFTKFLVDANGKVIHRYKATDNPAKIEVR